MRRGVFALTYFLLLSTALVDLYIMHGQLVRSEMQNQGTLMEAGEAFYVARNFEHDFRCSLADGGAAEFFDYWNSQGKLTYGRFQDFPEKGCQQVEGSFDQFLEESVTQEGQLVFFSPVGLEESCVTLEVDRGYFKTYGVIKSTVCVNISSPLSLC